MTLKVQDIQTVLNRVPVLNITETTTGEEADAAVGMLGELNGAALAVMRFSGLTPWELHTADELVHVLEGEVDLTLLKDRERLQFNLKAGQVFIVPQGLWHRQFARSVVTALFATPQPTQISMAVDPS